MDSKLEQRSLDAVANVPARDEPLGFMLRLTKALHTNGVPAYELEQTINACAESLGFGVQCISTPTAITLMLIGEDQQPQTFVIRAAPGEVNLQRLQEVTEIAEQVISGTLNAARGARELKRIAQQPPLYARWIIVASFAIVSGALARIFSGTWGEIIAAAAVGLMIGGLQLLSRRWSLLTHLFPAIAAFLATLVVFILEAVAHQQLSIYVSLVAGLVILLPGLTLTIAMAELATQNLVSGTARLFGATIIFVQLAFGSAIGLELGTRLFGPPVSINLTEVNNWTLWLAVVIASLALLPLFGARAKNAIWFVISGLVAFTTVRLSSASLGAVLAAFVGAISIGLLANIISYLMRIPRAVLLMPGFIILVPGTIGYKSITALINRDILGGLENAFDVALIGISLVAGLLLSSLVQLPRRDSELDL